MRGQAARLAGVAVLVAAAATVGPGATVRGVQRANAAVCAQQGTYTAADPAQGAQPIAPYTLALAGTLTLRSYSGCGRATAGSFAVHAVVRSQILPEHAAPARPSTGGAPWTRPAVDRSGMVSTSSGLSGVLTATGTLVQDYRHTGDPTFVLVTATVTYGTIVPRCTASCTQDQGASCLPRGCLVPGTLHTIAVSAITGYLHVQGGAPFTAGLAFLPMPGGTGGLASEIAAPVIFIGARSGA